MVSRISRIALVVCLLAGAAFATPASDILVLDVYQTAGPCRAVTGEGPTLHFATGGYLASADIAAPAAPELLALTWFGVQTQDVVLAPGDGITLACVCLGPAGLQLVDVTDPAAPQVRGGVSDFEAWRAVWAASRLYVVAGNEGVLVIDIADPDAPAVTGLIPPRPGHQPHALAARTSFLFVSFFDQTLEVFSLAQPDSPLLFGTTTGSYGALACWNDYLLALTTLGMDVIDATDFSHLDVIGSWTPADPAGRPMNLAPDGDQVWIADRMLGLHLVDLAVPTAPASLDLLPEREGQAWCVDPAGGVMACGLTGEGVRLCAAAAGQIDLLGTCRDPHPAPIAFLGTSGDLIVGADESRSLSVFSPAAPGAPTGQIGFHHDHFARIDGFDADGGLALLAAGLNHYPHTRMFVFDVSDPASPLEVYCGLGLPANPSGTGEVAMDGPLAFVDCTGIYAYDLADPTDPQNAGLYGFSHGTVGVELLEQDALCTWDPVAGGLVLVDRFDTWHMEVLEILPVPGVPTALMAHGDRFYVAFTPGIWVFDVTTPGQSELLGTVPIDGYVGDLAVSADGVWVALGAQGLQLWDLTDPQAPSLLASLTDQGRIDGVAAAGDHVVANASHQGLLWLQLDTTGAPGAPGTLVLRQNAPNPFNPRTEIHFRLDRPGPARVEVFDLQGRRVRLLLDRTLPAGQHNVTWDGRDGGGRPVASGSYVFRLVAGDRQLARSMTLVR